MNEVTRMAARNLANALEEGVDLEHVLAMVAGVGPEGPSLTACYQVAWGITSRSSRPTYQTHWRRLLRGFAIPVDMLELAVEVGDDLGIEVNPDPDAHPRVDDYLEDPDRDQPMLLLRPGLADRGLLSLRLPELHELVDWTRLLALTYARDKTIKRRAQGRPDFHARGDEAVRTFCVAFNKLYKAAYAENLISLQAVNPLTHFKRQARDPRDRIALSAEKVHELWWAVATDAYDAPLYAALVKFHIRVGAREEGAINLRLRDLDDTKQAVWLDEKFNKRLPVPVDAPYLAELRAFAAARGRTRPDDPVFCQKRRTRNRAGELEHPAITKRTYNGLHRRVQDKLEWAAADGVGVHWLRGHGAGLILSGSNEAVKKAWLRHKHRAAIDRYAPASFEHVAHTVGQVYGFVHPHATPYPGLDR